MTMHLVESHLLQQDKVVKACQTLAPRTVIIIEECLEKRVGGPLYQRFGENVDLLAIPGGEVCKSRAMKARIEDMLLQWGCLRDTSLLAVGGGALLDLVGFVAATYCRGIPYVSCPSTLLAMTDASIGGKTGINLPQGKNLLGAFYPATHVFCDLSLLESLPQTQWMWGLSETIKHGLIASPPLFALLEEEWERIVARDQALVRPVIEASARVKQEIVARDPFDREGERKLLNFGHTVGHALEASAKFALPHGEAVAVGMRVETELSYRLGKLSAQERDRAVALLDRLPYGQSMHFDPTAVRFDKKGETFIALCGIGKAESLPLSIKELRRAWDATMCCH